MLVLITFLGLIISFINSDFSNETVFNHSHTTKPLFYKIIPYSDMIFKDSPKAFQGIPQCERVVGCENNQQSLLEALNSKIKITHAGSTLYLSLIHI